MSQLNGIYVDNAGTMYARTGDSGFVVISGVPTDDNYKVSLGIYNPLNKKIIAETSASSSSNDEVTLNISTDMTTSVGPGRYFYAIKLSASGKEQTVVPRAFVDEQGVLHTPAAPIFLLSPKLVEGNE